MKYQNISIAVMLLSHYGIIHGHIYDAHVRTPSEIDFEIRYERDKETDDAQKIIANESSSEEEKADAWDSLFINGKII